jgi:hypothetical protein
MELTHTRHIGAHHSVHELTGCRRQAFVIEEIPEGRMRIRNTGDPLKVLREAAEHVPAVLVDFLSGGSGTVLGEHPIASFQSLLRRGLQFFFSELCEPGL